MTEISLVQAQDGSRLRCTASGHAGFARFGKDIVCSAVTVLMRTAVQFFSETGGIDFETDTSRRGFLRFSAAVKKSDSVLQKQICTIGDFLRIGFASLSEEFPKNVIFEFQLED